MTTLDQEILFHLHTLPISQQQEVLAFVRHLTTAPVGVSGSELLRFAGLVDEGDLIALERAVTEDTEQVNLDEW